MPLSTTLLSHASLLPHSATSLPARVNSHLATLHSLHHRRVGQDDDAHHHRLISRRSYVLAGAREGSAGHTSHAAYDAARARRGGCIAFCGAYWMGVGAYPAGGARGHTTTMPFAQTGPHPIRAATNDAQATYNEYYNEPDNALTMTPCDLVSGISPVHDRGGWSQISQRTRLRISHVL